MKNITVNGDRLWESLMEMARIGATEKGGNCRLALSDLDREGRDLFVRWCEAAGCGVEIDQMGNIFARRPGRDNSLPPVATGSHLDTQPTGGKFDGVYGVLAGLEVIRTLNDHGYETEAPVEAVVWTNEEGARFAPAMTASGVFAGVFGLEYAYGRRDPDGKTLGAELERIGYKGDVPCGGRPLAAFFEVHIEQGPILEAEGKPIGAARLVAEVNRIAVSRAPRAVATVGMLQVSPNSRNTIPGQVFLTVDLRHPKDAALSAMAGELKAACEAICRADGLELAFEEISYTPPVVFDPDCVETVRRGAEAAGYAHRDMISGAGHDACHISGVAPTAMVFVPCADGISHNEVESAEPQDLAAGCNVLLNAILERAGGL